NYDDLELVRPQDYVIASESYAERGDLSRAVSELDRGLAVFREFAPLHVYAGRMRERAGDSAGALRASREAQRLEPGPREAGAGAPAAPVLTVAGPAEQLAPPVAVVNGVTICRVTYEGILDALREHIPPGDPDSVERYIGARDLALEKAIDEELLFQHAVKKG